MTGHDVGATVAFADYARDVEALRKQLADAQATVEALQRERDEVSRKYHEAMDIMSAWKNIDHAEAVARLLEANKALDAERDRLRKALRPFAEVGDALDTREFINLYERWGTSGKRHVISMQHLKHAAAVYGVTK